MSSSSRLQFKGLKRLRSAKCRSEDNVCGIPEKVDLALHAKPGLPRRASAEELPKKSPLVPIASKQSIGMNYVEDLPGSSWERVMRTVVRCLMYCIDRIAAGFGLSRQQTAWYKHCWDSPAPHPRGISFLGANDVFIAPTYMMDELADDADI